MTFDSCGNTTTLLSTKLALSSLVAALPIFVLLFLLGVRRTPAWIAAISGLGTTVLVSFFLYGMPVGRIVAAATYGAAYGWFPIGWIVFWAVYLYRLTLDTGKFETIKHSLRSLTRDPRLQTLLIAFAFGAFLEARPDSERPSRWPPPCSLVWAFHRFTPPPFVCSRTPRRLRSDPLDSHRHSGRNYGSASFALERGVGRICAPVSLIVPGYLVVVMGGWGALARVFPAAVLCGVTFASFQFAVSNFVGPQLTDLIASLAAMGVLVMLFMFWKPKDSEKYEISAAAKAAEKSEHSTGTSVSGMVPLLFAGGLCTVMGLATHAEAAEFGELSRFPGRACTT